MDGLDDQELDHMIIVLYVYYLSHAYNDKRHVPQPTLTWGSQVPSCCGIKISC